MSSPARCRTQVAPTPRLSPKPTCARSKTRWRSGRHAAWPRGRSSVAPPPSARGDGRALRPRAPLRRRRRGNARRRQLTPIEGPVRAAARRDNGHEVAATAGGMTPRRWHVHGVHLDANRRRCDSPPQCAASSSRRASSAANSAPRLVDLRRPRRRRVRLVGVAFPGPDLPPVDDTRIRARLGRPSSGWTEVSGSLSRSGSSQTWRRTRAAPRRPATERRGRTSATVRQTSCAHASRSLALQARRRRFCTTPDVAERGRNRSRGHSTTFQAHRNPAPRAKPTRGFEPRTPSLRVKCSTS